LTERPRAFSYVRMSTPGQLLGDSLRRQLEASRTYASTHGLELVEEPLQDLGVSAYKGANVSEGSLGRFLDAVRSGKVPTGSFLLVESLDRISRQEIRKALTTFLSIIDAGINLVTLNDAHVYSAQTTDVTDLIVSLVAMSRAHGESLQKSQRVAAAWANKRKNASTRPLTANCPAWLRLNGDRSRFEVIETRADTVRYIFAESSAGIGSYTITRRLNEKRVPCLGPGRGWQSSSVKHVLSNRAVLGEYQCHRYVNGNRVPDGEPVKGYFPAIIDETTFYRVQAGLGQRRGRGGRKGPSIVNLFAGGILTCAYCGGAMKRDGKGERGRSSIVCYGALHGLGCERARWAYRDFEASALSFVRELDLASIMSDDESRRAVLDNEIAALNGQLGEVRGRMEKAYELLDSGAATDFVAKKLRELEARGVELEDVIREKKGVLDELRSEQRGLDDVKPLIEQLRGPGDEVYRTRSMIASRLRSIVETILVAPQGQAPLNQRAIEVARQHGDRAVVDHLQRMTDRRRYCVVVFKDGSMRAVYPSGADPMQFEEQVTSSKGDGLIRHAPDSRDVIFQPDHSDLADEVLRIWKEGECGGADEP
jgi:DNA invertase Pin-like site-specific DNA recombinase